MQLAPNEFALCSSRPVSLPDAAHTEFVYFGVMREVVGCAGGGEEDGGVGESC